MYFLSRESPSSPAEQHAHTYDDDADNSIPAETEPATVESWENLNHHRSGPRTKDGGLCFWRHAALLTAQHAPGISCSICYVWTLCAFVTSNQKGPVAQTVWSIIYHHKRGSDSLWRWASPLLFFLKCTFPFILHSARPGPSPSVPLLLAAFSLPHELFLWSLTPYVHWITFLALLARV